MGVIVNLGNFVCILKFKVFNASNAAGNLSLWIRAVVSTYGALLVVEPKRRMLEDA